MSKYSFIRQLEKALADLEVGRSHLPMVEAERRARQRKIVLESRAPQAGAFWFIPQDDKWEIYSFFESNHASSTDHYLMWAKYVAPLLIPNPPRAVKNAYAGLPRGRVVVYPNGTAKIFHGDDLPEGETSILKVAREFNLPRGKYKAVFEAHERMLPDDYRVIKQALRHNLQLAAPVANQHDADFFDDFDDDWS